MNPVDNRQRHGQREENSPLHIMHSFCDKSATNSVCLKSEGRHSDRSN
jgi:hypothetical protein